MDSYDSINDPTLSGNIWGHRGDHIDRTETEKQKSNLHQTEYARNVKLDSDNLGEGDSDEDAAKLKDENDHAIPFNTDNVTTEPTKVSLKDVVPGPPVDAGDEDEDEDEELKVRCNVLAG